MLELRQGTEVIVPIGPFVDVADGFTPQTDITLGGNEAEVLKHGSDTVVDISGATWAAVTDCRGWYSLTLTTSLTDTLGILKVIVQDDSDCLPVDREFMVVTQQYWDSKYSTDVRQVDVTQWLGQAVTADSNVPEVHVVGLDADVITATKIADNAIAAEHIANGAIDNATFAADVGSTAYATNIIALAVRKVLDELKLDHLVAVADSDDVVTNSVIAKLAATDGDWSAFSLTTDSLQSIRDKLPANLEDLAVTDTTGLVSVGTIGNNVITAAAIADAAIDNATFAADVGSTAYATNIIALAADKALVEQKLDHLVAVADADDVVDDSVLAKMASTTGDWSLFVDTTDALQSIRDQGDAAWITAVGFSTHAAADVVTAVLASTAWDSSGTMTYGDAIETVWAVTCGNVARTGDVYVYDLPDDGTTGITLTVASGTRTRS
ncbi:MAG TPA: hypothetical protein VM487_18670 [Phycisphaerae bacterium]|nr:hypothetical protein [Phycisphaerae bacterium]